MITKLAVRWLIEQLKKDKALWYAYQANIAMIIFDNMTKYLPLKTDPQGSPTKHEFCNICANDFLNLWTGSNNRIS